MKLSLYSIFTSNLDKLNKNWDKLRIKFRYNKFEIKRK